MPLNDLYLAFRQRFLKKFSYKPFNKWIIALVLIFLKAKDVLIILIFKTVSHATCSLYFKKSFNNWGKKLPCQYTRSGWDTTQAFNTRLNFA